MRNRRRYISGARAFDYSVARGSCQKYGSQFAKSAAGIVVYASEGEVMKVGNEDQELRGDEDV